MHYITKFIIAILCAAINTACSTQQTIEQKLDTYFNSIDGHFMGSVMVVKDGQTIYQRSMGFADVENQIPATAETQYRIGSISKTFTAVLVMKAAAEGRLSLNDPIAKYFPEAHIPNDELITIDHLLQHRSGVVDIVTQQTLAYLTYYRTSQTRQQMLEHIASAGTNFTPGSSYRYSNSGYHLLAFILEKVYGKSYAELIEEHIARPLGLKHTRHSESIDTKKGDAHSYVYMGDWRIAAETNTSVAVGAGSLASTTDDLVKFATAFSTRFFGYGIVEQMMEMKDGYGRGLHTCTGGERDGYGHSGLLDEFNSLLAVFDDTIVALCSNGKDQSINIYDILHIVNDKDIDIPTFDNVQTIDSQQFENFVGNYFIEGLGIELNLITGNGTLYMEVLGQIIPLKATSESTFENSALGVRIEMDTQDNQIKLNLSGQDFILTELK